MVTAAGQCCCSIVDHFKAVNDRFGHKAGDDLLKAVAATLRGRMRETDVLARLGGDEFGIILPRVDGAKAEKVADGIVKALRRQTAMPAEHHVPVTASVGVALFDGLTNMEIMAAADLAMYEAKALGRDRFAVYQQPYLAAQEVASPRAGAEMLHTRMVAAVSETGRLGPQIMNGHRQSPRRARGAERVPRPPAGRVGFLLAGARRRRQTVRAAPADNATAQSRRHLPCRTVMKCLVPETKFAVRTAYGRAVDTGGAAALTGSRGSVSVS